MTTSRFYTVYEIMRVNSGTFPFWLTSWQPRHSCALVKDFGFFEDNDKQRVWISANPHDDFIRNTYYHIFLCDLYALDKSRLLKSDVSIPGHNTQNWLPY